MKNSLKTLAMWLIIGIIFIVVVSAVLENSETKLTYSELLIAIESGNVSKIEIQADGKKAYVELKDSKIEKKVNIPSLDSFMDKVNDYIVAGDFILEEKTESIIITILGLLSPFAIAIVFFVFWFLFMNNAQGRKQNNDFWKKQS